MKVPEIDLSECILCEVCREESPSVFKLNDAGYIEVSDLEVYPQDEVDDAIENCPSSCISWV